MTVMLLALIFSDAALASEYRLTGDQQVDTRFEPRPRTREWKPGVDGWTSESRDCPAFFQREADGVGFLRVGPLCEDEEIPYAL